MQVGDVVRVLPPFTIAFPYEYTVLEVKADGTCVIEDDRDFDPVYLEKV